MPAQRGPRCFVAMAFDHDDTDALYELHIRPVLRRNGVTPVIINRRHSNDDLNNQIIGQLDACDFAIADLTYARQSVYFEAGYAQRTVPVIYTVRTDHLKGGQADDRRVHFDLQMKPLIRWSGPNDATFAARLERRLRATVLRDWRRATLAADRLAKDRAAFNALAIGERLTVLRRRAIAMLRLVGFTSWEPHPPEDGLVHSYPDLARCPWTITAKRRRPGRLTVVSLRVLPTFVRRDLTELLYRTSPIGAALHEPMSAWPRQVAVHNLACTLRTMSRHQLDALNLAAGERPGQYVPSAVTGVHRGPEAVGTFRATLNFIDGIKSEPEFRVALRDLIAEVIVPGRRMAPAGR
ncbi:MAG TPA: hypothetical protein VIV88_02270 [Gemmatimonadales bacterium]|jgi:nucleoside 2-deoxyribosyltransferase